jgi:hypothetical protein
MTPQEAFNLVDHVIDIINMLRTDPNYTVQQRAQFEALRNDLEDRQDVVLKTIFDSATKAYKDATDGLTKVAGQLQSASTQINNFVAVLATINSVITSVDSLITTAAGVAAKI